MNIALQTNNHSNPVRLHSIKLFAELFLEKATVPFN